MAENNSPLDHPRLTILLPFGGEMKLSANEVQAFTVCKTVWGTLISCKLPLNVLLHHEQCCFLVRALLSIA